MSTPSSKLYLYAGVPLDNTYKDVYNYFVLTRNGVFSSFTKATFTELSWIRTNKNTVRISVANSSPDIYDKYNYLAFKNTNSDDGIWYFCFILEHNYINDNTLELVFEIDVWTTYHDLYSFQQCFIERETVQTDAIGSYTLPEPVDIGEDYITLYPRTTIPISEQGWDVMLLFIPSLEDSYNAVSERNGVMTAYKVVFSPNNVASLAMFIRDYLMQGYQLNSAVYVPSKFVIDSGAYVGDTVTVPRPETLDNSYTPQNNKLYTFPYIGCELSNQRGETAFYKYELWSGGNAKFKMYGTAYPQPTALTIPIDYAGATEADNFDSGLYIKDFPTVSLQGNNMDTFLNMNKTSLAVSGITSALSLGLGGLATGIAGGTAAVLSGSGMISGVGSAGGMIADIEKARKSATHITSATSVDLLNSLTGHTSFIIKNKSIKYEYLKAIDNYFTRFGYRVDKLKVPDLNCRAKFTYIKTRDCTLKDEQLPAWAAKKICNIMDNGVTVWKIINVGDYSNNAPNN